MENTAPVTIVRPSSRRKFLVALLGSGAILGFGSLGLAQLAQNVQVAFHTRNYPYNSGDDLVGEDFSPDLNFMGMVKVGEMDNADAKLYIWDYQQQRMSMLPTGPGYGDPAAIWSPDNRYMLYQLHAPDDSSALDLWDLRTQKKLRTYTGNDYAAFSEIHWSPDGTRVGLLLKDLNNIFVVMDPMSLQPLSSFHAPAQADAFAWSPDGQKVAFLLNGAQGSFWSVQIWDVHTSHMSAERAFQASYSFPDLITLAWSPDGTHLAALAHGQLQILHVGDTLTGFTLDNSAAADKLAWSPDGRYLAVSIFAPFSGAFASLPHYGFNVWDIAERKVARSFDRGTSDDIKALVWSKNGRQIIVIGDLYRQENWGWS